MTHPASNRVVILESNSSEVIARNIAKNEADAETLAREITQLDQDISVSALMLRLRGLDIWGDEGGHVSAPRLAECCCSPGMVSHI